MPRSPPDAGRGACPADPRVASVGRRRMARVVHPPDGGSTGSPLWYDGSDPEVPMAADPSFDTVPVSVVRRRAAMFGVLAVAVALGTAVAVWTLVSRYQAGVENVLAHDGLASVVFAARALEPGEVITADDLIVDRVADRSQEGLFRSVDEVAGQTVADLVLAGEPIRAARLTTGGGALTLQELIDDGNRAVTILASRAAAVGGLLRPGAVVDVILTIRPGRGAGPQDWVSETILQGVRVLGVGSAVSKTSTEDDDVDPSAFGREVYVTLEVDPVQAEKLALGATRGTLTLALRSPRDVAAVSAAGPTGTNALLGLPADRPAAPRAEGTEMRVIRGAKVKVESFDDAGRPAGAPSTR